MNPDKTGILLLALEKIAEQQQETLKIIESNGFVFKDIGREPGNWQHLAFSLYADICEIDLWARSALSDYYERELF